MTLIHNSPRSSRLERPLLPGRPAMPAWTAPVAVLVAVLAAVAPGCTETIEDYCDGRTVCRRPGYTCDYAHRRCVPAGDWGAGDGTPDWDAGDGAPDWDAGDGAPDWDAGDAGYDTGDASGGEGGVSQPEPASDTAPWGGG